MNGLKKMLMVVAVFAIGTGSLFAQGSSSGGDGAAAAAGAAVGLVLALVYFVIIAVVIVGQWKMFVKAGKPGWAAIIPIYNFIVLWQVSNQPVWALILCFLPFVNIIGGIMIAIGIANSFGKGTGFALGLIFIPIVFYPLLGFGDAQYQGA